MAGATYLRWSSDCFSKFLTSKWRNPVRFCHYRIEQRILNKTTVALFRNRNIFVPNDLKLSCSSKAAIGDVKTLLRIGKSSIWRRFWYYQVCQKILYKTSWAIFRKLDCVHPNWEIKEELSGSFIVLEEWRGFDRPVGTIGKRGHLSGSWRWRLMKKGNPEATLWWSVSLANIFGRAKFMFH